MRGDGSWCGLHYDRECRCAYHCTGCRHAYGPMRQDCCTCCHPVEIWHMRDDSGRVWRVEPAETVFDHRGNELDPVYRLTLAREPSSRGGPVKE